MIKTKKSIILIILAIITIANYSNAQENTIDVRDKLMIGLKAGFNLSNVYDAQGEQFNADAKFGLAAGAFVAIPIGTYIGIQPEILFSQKGFKATTVILGNTYDFTRITNYIDIPLLFSLKPIKSLALLIGPQYSYLLNQKDVFSDGTTSTQQQTAFENDNIRKNILSFTGGVDINLNHIVLGARVGRDVQQNNGDGTSTTPRYKNVWYQATIGYRFYTD
jgi:Outer membrane protein beta-barrel domain